MDEIGFSRAPVGVRASLIGQLWNNANAVEVDNDNRPSQMNGVEDILDGVIELEKTEI